MKKIIIIDDSPFTRKILKEMIEEEKDFRVIDTANNGAEGLKKVLKLRPDLITLDLEMPELDGYSFLRFLMAQQPTPTIVVSSLNSSESVFKALELGAVDFVVKPTSHASYQLLEIKKDLVFKIKASLLSRLKAGPAEKAAAHAPAPPPVLPLSSALNVVAIGSSTGGPQAIQQILTSIGRRLNVAVLIAQHMPEGFTKVFAERLDRLCDNFRIKEGEDGELVTAGTVYISPGGFNMGVAPAGNDLRLTVLPRKHSDIYVPSVNYLFDSLGPIAKRCLAIVLTGMGADGKKGAVHLKGAGAEIWAESKETAVIFGMPQEVIKAGAAQQVLPLNDIARALEEKFKHF